MVAVAILYVCLAADLFCGPQNAVRTYECMPDIALSTCPNNGDVSHYDMGLPPGAYRAVLGPRHALAPVRR